MLSINRLMKYLRNHHQITVKSNQAQSLRNIGYYHGYKGIVSFVTQTSAFLFHPWMRL